jgi:repressor LexA
MRSKRLELMDQISAYIDQYYCEKHTTPSVNEIAKGVGISKATSYRYLVAMDERGMLEYDGPSRTIVTKLISKFSTGSFSAPVVGAIPCGEPEIEEENIVEYVSLPVSLFGRGDFYILKADGDSMTDAGIDNGDMVVIRKQSSANVGDIVVALDERQLNTLKLYSGVDEKTGEAILRYCNKERYPGKEIRVRELVVQGVAKHVIKALG